MLKAVTFHQEIRTGSSLSLIVTASDGRRYVLKARGSGDGALASVVDWLALGLGRWLGIPVLEPQAMRVEHGFESQAGDPEIRELLEKSHGTNFATRYVEDARSPDDADLSRLPPQTLCDIFLFDLFLLNLDRYGKNPNAIVSADGFFCLDFSSAVTLRGLLTDTRFAEATFLKQIRRNPFYTPEVDPESFIERLQTISSSWLRNLIDGLPDDWLHVVARGVSLRDFRRGLATRLQALLEEGAILRNRLEVLQTIQPETKEERYRRSLANKAEFKRRFGKL